MGEVVDLKLASLVDDQELDPAGEVDGGADELKRLTDAARSAGTFELDAVNVGQPSLARRRTRPRDRAVRQRVDQARLADVGSSSQRHLRQAVARDTRPGGRNASDEVGG